MGGDNIVSIFIAGVIAIAGVIIFISVVALWACCGLVAEERDGDGETDDDNDNSI
jgi:hypothetical protein